MQTKKNSALLSRAAIREEIRNPFKQYGAGRYVNGRDSLNGICVQPRTLQKQWAGDAIMTWNLHGVRERPPNIPARNGVYA